MRSFMFLFYGPAGEQQSGSGKGSRVPPLFELLRNLRMGKIFHIGMSTYFVGEIVSRGDLFSAEFTFAKSSIRSITALKSWSGWSANSALLIGKAAAAVGMAARTAAAVSKISRKSLFIRPIANSGR